MQPSVTVAFVRTTTSHKASMRKLIDKVIRLDITIPQSVVDTLNLLAWMADGKHTSDSAVIATSDLDRLEELGCIRVADDFGIELV